MLSRPWRQARLTMLRFPSCLILLMPVIFGPGINRLEAQYVASAGDCSRCGAPKDPFAAQRAAAAAQAVERVRQQQMALDAVYARIAASRAQQQRAADAAQAQRQRALDQQQSIAQGIGLLGQLFNDIA